MNGWTPTPKNEERKQYDAMREQEFLAMQLAAEQQRVNSVAYYGGLADIDEQIRQAKEIASDVEWLGEPATVEEATAVQYGESMMDWQKEAESEGQEFVDVKFGSKRWFDNIEPLEF